MLSVGDRTRQAHGIHYSATQKKIFFSLRYQMQNSTNQETIKKETPNMIIEFSKDIYIFAFKLFTNKNTSYGQKKI